MKGAVRTVYSMTAASYDTSFNTSGAGVAKSTGVAATECNSTASSSGFLGDQWNIKVYNPAVNTSVSGVIPASTTAADQVDAVHNSPTDFFSLLQDALTAAGANASLTVGDMYVSQLGFIVGFLTASDSSPDLSIESTATTGGSKVYFPWWAWLLYAGIIVCCLLPLIVCVCRRRKEVEEEEQEADYAVKARAQEGLNKIYGPEWGITEVDFEEDYMHYEDRDMQAEYENAHAAGAATAGTGAGGVGGAGGAVEGAHGVSDAAWEQQAGAARSDWAGPRRGDSADGQAAAVRRFDIDED
ncbi:unnamed protein product [Phaeothamnion confervicola]